VCGEGLELPLEAERAQLPPWFVVGFGTGITGWFALGSRVEWEAFLCVAAAAAVGGVSFAEGRARRARPGGVRRVLVGEGAGRPRPRLVCTGRSAWLRPRLGTIGVGRAAAARAT